MKSWSIDKETGMLQDHDTHKEEPPPVFTPNEETVAAIQELGKKYDSGKLDWTLLPFSSLEGAVRVLMFGAEKYGRFNWELVENGEQRYTAALLRHLFSYISGEKTDPETGMCHMSHVLVNAIFVEALRRKK